eukprot:Skav209835  [mRNA]  locus=scaffold2703:226376:226954:- [translate_table: standard]
MRQRIRLSGREISAESTTEYKLLQQARDEAVMTRRIALGSLLVALCSVVAVFLLHPWNSFENSFGFPANMEEIKPGWVWTTVPAIVRSEKSKQSKQLGIVEAETRVLVKEVQGTRARISEPMSGWISCISGDVQVVTRHETDSKIKRVKETILAHQKSQRDLLGALEEVKKKGLHPKLLGQLDDKKFKATSP